MLRALGCGGVSTILAEKNCTQYNGTWFNSTCYAENAAPAAAYAILNVTANGSMVTHDNLTEFKARSPADEYFQ